MGSLAVCWLCLVTLLSAVVLGLAPGRAERPGVCGNPPAMLCYRARRGVGTCSKSSEDCGRVVFTVYNEFCGQEMWSG